MQKKSSAVLQFIMLYSENGKQDPLFITNYAIINVLDVLSRTPGVGQARSVRRAQLFDAHLVRHQPAHQSATDAGRRDRRDPGAERGGAGRPHRRTPDRQRPAIPDEHPDAGPPDDARAVRQHRAARQSRRVAVAGAGRRAGRARRAERGYRGAPQRPPGGRDRHLPFARRQCGPSRCCGQSQPGPLERALSARPQISCQLRHDDFRHRHDPRRA